MKLKTISRVNTKLDNNEIIVYIEGNNPSQLERFKDYINLYNQKLTLAMDGKICSISIDNIICFYFKDRYTYCTTKDGDYKVDSSLYKLQAMNKAFISASRNCIVNINHIKTFGFDNERKMIAELSNGKKVHVSRRKVHSIINILEKGIIN